MDVGRAITEAMHHQKMLDDVMRWVPDLRTRRNIRHLNWFHSTYKLNPSGPGFVRR